MSRDMSGLTPEQLALVEANRKEALARKRSRTSALPDQAAGPIPLQSGGGNETRDVAGDIGSATSNAVLGTSDAIPKTRPMHRICYDRPFCLSVAQSLATTQLLSALAYSGCWRVLMRS